MATMKAVRMHGYGGRDVLVYEDAPCPDVRPGELLIRVRATSVNPFDCAARNGYVAGYYSYTFPHILGLDVAGEVEAVGAGVEDFAVGEAVYARSDPAVNGTYAEYIALPEAAVARKPKTLDWNKAAAVPHTSYSAWMALFDAAHLTKGQTVLIHGAAGGVGTMAVQLAKLHGAHVIGTSSKQNGDYLRDLGADEVIDYNTTRFEDAVRDMDVVLDLIGDAGDSTQTRSWGVLKPGGSLVSMVQFPSQEMAAKYQVIATMAAAANCTGAFLKDMGDLIDRGLLRPVVSTVLPLAEIQRAHEQIESRHTRGKIVLEV